MRKLTQDEFVQKAKQIHGNKYDYSESVFVNTRTKIAIVCPKHGVFTQTVSSHLMGHGCPNCAVDAVRARAGDEDFYNRVYTPERQAKMEATCMERYGAKTFALSSEGRAKIDAIKSTQEFRQKMHNIIASDIVQTRTRQTCRERYGTDSFMQTDNGRQIMHEAMTKDGVMDRVIQKKKQNGTVNTSKPEEELYQILCDLFGIDDVVRQYRSDVYPFFCDFYIKSLNFYIEHNVCWTHGGHWFDIACDDDKNRAICWAEKDSRYYDNAVDTWTVRDVEKRKIAAINDLNYAVFWKANLADVYDWVNDGCPIRKDWM